MPPRLISAPAAGRGEAPGTCGELAQGTLPGGGRFHVTCPIDRGARVRVEIEPAVGGVTEVVGIPPARAKVRRALLLAAEQLELAPTLIRVVGHATELETGKGMASSTADIVAAARALADAAGAALPPAALGHLAATIESSDGIMYPGICAVDHKSGALVRRWEWWPSFAIAMAVPAATLDTAAADFSGQDALASDYAAVLAALDAATAARDTAAFARQSTQSALLNERFVASPVRATLGPFVDRLGALGLVVGHTGTLAGLLFDGNTEDGRAAARAAAAELAAALPASVTTSVVHTPLLALLGAGS